MHDSVKHQQYFLKTGALYSLKYILLMSLFLFGQLNMFAQWKRVHSGITDNLFKLQAARNHAYIIGAKGSFLYSQDSGSTWEYKPFDGLENLRGMHFDLSGRGAICGENAVIYTTQNHGQSWSQKYSNSLYYLNAIAFKDQNMLAVGRKGIALYSQDSGNSWNPLFTRTKRQFYDCIALPNDYFIASSDSGYIHFFKNVNQDSQSLTKLNTDLIVRTLQLLPDGTLIASGGNPDTLGLNNLENFVAWSSDTGKSWTLKHWEQRRQFNHSHFFSSDSGYFSFPSGLIGHTFDRGNTFNLHYVGTPINLTSLYFYNANQGIAVGDVGRIYKTQNGGGFGLSIADPIIPKPIRVGPNPSQGTVNIHSAVEGYAQIYSFAGQKVQSISLQANTTASINLKPGNYFVYFIDLNNRKSEPFKLVVKKP